VGSAPTTSNLPTTAQPFPGYTGGNPVQQGPQPPPGAPGYPAPPDVPALTDGKGNTSVNTDALGVVAGNMDTLYNAVQQAYQVLSGAPRLAPGGLFESYQLKNKVGFPHDGQPTSLASSYLQVLQDLGQGLSDIKSALAQMQKTYTTFDDLNKIKIQDLENDLTNAEADFTNVITDGGGKAPTAWPAPVTLTNPALGNPGLTNNPNPGNNPNSK
jgi:hypothetical protein